MSETVTRLLSKLLRAYSLAISPYLPPSCRHEPSCSTYAQQALQHYRPLAAIWLITKRLARCHPWHAGGYDPLPHQVIPNTTRPRQRGLRSDLHGNAGR